MTLSPARVAAKVSELQTLHGRYDSWRDVKKLHYPTIPAGTLCRIAKSGGAYLPKMHWRALGLLNLDDEEAYRRLFKRTFVKLLKELRG